MIKVLFFARVKEELDCACLDIAWQADIADLDSLQAYLCRRGGPRWQEVLNRSNMIRAINQPRRRVPSTLAFCRDAASASTSYNAAR